MLDIWTIYRNPRDHPGKYVARLFVGETATDQAIVVGDLELLRGMMRAMGLACLNRADDDDESIVETWF